MSLIELFKKISEKSNSSNDVTKKPQKRPISALSSDTYPNRQKQEEQPNGPNQSIEEDALSLFKQSFGPLLDDSNSPSFPSIELTSAQYQNRLAAVLKSFVLEWSEMAVSTTNLQIHTSSSPGYSPSYSHKSSVVVRFLQLNRPTPPQSEMSLDFFDFLGTSVVLPWRLLMEIMVLILQQPPQVLLQAQPAASAVIDFVSQAVGDDLSINDNDNNSSTKSLVVSVLTCLKQLVQQLEQQKPVDVEYDNDANNNNNDPSAFYRLSLIGSLCHFRLKILVVGNGLLFPPNPDEMLLVQTTMKLVMARNHTNQLTLSCLLVISQWYLMCLRHSDFQFAPNTDTVTAYNTCTRVIQQIAKHSIVDKRGLRMKSSTTTARTTTTTTTSLFDCSRLVKSWISVWVWLDKHRHQNQNSQPESEMDPFCNQLEEEWTNNDLKSWWKVLEYYIRAVDRISWFHTSRYGDVESDGECGKSLAALSPKAHGGIELTDSSCLTFPQSALRLADWISTLLYFVTRLVKFALVCNPFQFGPSQLEIRQSLWSHILPVFAHWFTEFSNLIQWWCSVDNNNNQNRCYAVLLQRALDFQMNWFDSLFFACFDQEMTKLRSIWNQQPQQSRQISHSNHKPIRFTQWFRPPTPALLNNNHNTSNTSMPMIWTWVEQLFSDHDVLKWFASQEKLKQALGVSGNHLNHIYTPLMTLFLVGWLNKIQCVDDQQIQQWKNLVCRDLPSYDFLNSLYTHGLNKFRESVNRWYLGTNEESSSSDSSPLLPSSLPAPLPLTWPNQMFIHISKASHLLALRSNHSQCSLENSHCVLQFLALTNSFPQFLSADKRIQFLISRDVILLHQLKQQLPWMCARTGFIATADQYAASTTLQNWIDLGLKQLAKESIEDCLFLYHIGRISC